MDYEKLTKETIDRVTPSAEIRAGLKQLFDEGPLALGVVLLAILKKNGVDRLVAVKSTTEFVCAIADLPYTEG